MFIEKEFVLNVPSSSTSSVAFLGGWNDKRNYSSLLSGKWAVTVTPHSWAMVRQISYSGDCFWIVLYTALQSERGVTIFLLSITDHQEDAGFSSTGFLWIQFYYSWGIQWLLLRYFMSCGRLTLVFVLFKYLDSTGILDYWLVLGCLFSTSPSSFVSFSHVCHIFTVWESLQCWEFLKF